MKGLGTALVTPFMADKQVDYAALAALLDKQIAGGVDYLVVLGTTAETATLSSAEKKAVREYVVDYVAGRLPIVLGIGGNNTQQVIADIQETDLTPYAAILSVCPYYNKPSQEGLYQHFAAIAEKCEIPIILYNVPGRTGVNMLPETVMRIYEAFPEKIMGVKEASGNVAQIRQLINLAGNRFAVISGDDGIAHELMQAGAAGLISVASNAFPDAFWEIVHNRQGAAEALQDRFAEMVRLLFVEGNPAGIKTVLSLQGVVQNELRLPLVANSEGVQREIADEIEAMRLMDN